MKYYLFALLALSANAVRIEDYHDHDGDAQDDDDSKLVANIKIFHYDDVADLASANSHGIYSPDALAIVPEMPELKALNQAAMKQKEE